MISKIYNNIEYSDTDIAFIYSYILFKTSIATKMIMSQTDPSSSRYTKQKIAAILNTLRYMYINEKYHVMYVVPQCVNGDALNEMYIRNKNTTLIQPKYEDMHNSIVEYFEINELETKNAQLFKQYPLAKVKTKYECSGPLKRFINDLDSFIQYE